MGIIGIFDKISPEKNNHPKKPRYLILKFKLGGGERRKKVNLGTFQNEGGERTGVTQTAILDPAAICLSQIRQSAVAGEFGVSVAISGGVEWNFIEKMSPNKTHPPARKAVFS